MASVWTSDLRVRVCLRTDEEQREQNQPQQILHCYCRDTMKEKQVVNFTPRDTSKYVFAFVS